MVDSTPSDRNPIQQTPLNPFPNRKRLGTAPPVPLTSFVGREREVAAITRLLHQDGARLVTLTGPGGVGKTRLALRVVETLGADFADGVAFVPLAPLTESNLVAATIAHAVGVQESGGRSSPELLVDALADRRLLLVLDNFEHLVEAAPLVPSLLAACPNLVVMATSRIILRVSGEQCFPVLPLRLPEAAETDPIEAVGTAEAVRLFLDRAKAAEPYFTMTTGNAFAIGEICRRLDGLPLAIELAAARITLLPPTVMLSRIEPRLPLLTGGPRDAPARLQTMRDAIAWSHKLISVDEQVLFRRLGVFVGGFSLEAAEAVTDFERPALDGIAVLVGSSLLRQEAASDPVPNPDVKSSPRFGMLETVREFALEQLAASGEADLIRGRHAAWYLELAEESEMITREGPDQERCLAQFEAELPNLRQALSWLEETGATEATLRLAGALCGLWFHRSHREGSVWLERALAAVEATPSAGRAKALRALALLGLSLGGPHAAEHAAESAAMWTELGDVWRAAEARMLLGQILEYRTDYARAIPLLEESAREWDAMGDPGRAAVALYFLGQAALDHEDGPRAEALFEEARGRFLRGGYVWLASLSLHQLGEVAAMRGSTAAAATYYAESLACSGPRENLVGKLVATARLAAVGGQPQAAARLFGAAEALADIIGYARRPPEQRRLDRDAAIARDSLGDASFQSAWATGKALPTDQAVAEARAILTLLGAPALPNAPVSSTPAPATEMTSLTPREQEVLALMCAHLQDREIAERLFLSPRTVEGHVSHILGKLGVSSRREAVDMAARLTLA